MFCLLQAHSLTTEYSTTFVQKILYFFAALGKELNLFHCNKLERQFHEKRNSSNDDWWWWQNWYWKRWEKTTIMMMMRMSRLTKEFTPSQHDLNPAFADKPPAGFRRPARQCFGLHIFVHACAGWCPPYVHPALPRPPLQSRPHCQRPQSFQQTTTIMLGIDQVGSNIFLQLLLLLHPELPVAIFQGEWRLQYCSWTFNILKVNGAFCKWENIQLIAGTWYLFEWKYLQLF